MVKKYLFILEDSVCLVALGLAKSSGVCTVGNYEVVSFLADPQLDLIGNLQQQEYHLVSTRQ
jgi:hypothetical protein